jgi:hypothetical protein
LVEHRDGRLELVQWQPDHQSAKAAQPQPSSQALPHHPRPDTTIGPANCPPFPAFQKAAVGEKSAAVLTARVSDNLQR